MIGEDIHYFLDKKGFTAAKLSDLIGITAVQLSRIMNGHSSPSRMTMEKIAKTLNADVSFSSYSGEWSLISRILGVSMRSMYSRRCNSINSDSCCSADILSIPVINIYNMPYSILCDHAKMERVLTEASDFMAVPLKDLGTVRPNSPYAVRMRSGSMLEAGTPYASYVAINPNEPVYDGDSVLFQWGEQKNIAVRWFFDYCEEIKLCSANPIKYPPIILKKTGLKTKDACIDGNDLFHILGKVMAVYLQPENGV